MMQRSLQKWLMYVWPGLLSLGFIALILGFAFNGLVSEIKNIDLARIFQNNYLFRVIGFTFFQAGLSTLLATLVAIPVARALARRPTLPGRKVFLQLASLSLIIPTIVGVFGVVAIHGRNGWLNQFLALFDISAGNYLYGLTGILIAHVFFNAPLLLRIFLQSLESLPPEYWRTTAQLGMTGTDIFRLVEWPLLRRIIPASCGLVFLLCFTSFAVVLALGGGPSTNTLEVAIYQAIRFDFDIPKAVVLSLAQLSLCFILLMIGSKFAGHISLQKTEERSIRRFDARHTRAKITDSLALLVMVFLVVPPLLATIWKALSPRLIAVITDEKLWTASFNSLLISLTAGSIALILAIGIALMLRSLQSPYRLGRHRLASPFATMTDLSGSIILLLPPFVLATGLFITFRAAASLTVLAPFLVVIVNALMTLPFILRILIPAFETSAQKSDHLCDNLGIKGLNRIRIVDWPQNRNALGLALGLSVALSTGDLSVIALFGTQDFTTLPLLMFQKMGSYRLDDAAITALFLCLQSLMLFILIERTISGKGFSRSILKPNRKAISRV
ncbi:thiamine/thiamine pyrophosphate ABC transporter permease [Kiloniella majae]|uniref:thiamine/thiamine pyrophosphate ABC transporter permease n=1 Tax=Kiloniella majae TaxID=1938558 RepID=UPI000A278852|nr:thiamine/thiamine pyrophosphate ABC transporter permease [Kiloniella majae]